MWNRIGVTNHFKNTHVIGVVISFVLIKTAKEFFSQNDFDFFASDIIEITNGKTRKYDAMNLLSLSEYTFQRL